MHMWTHICIHYSCFLIADFLDFHDYHDRMPHIYDTSYMIYTAKGISYDFPFDAFVSQIT